VAAVVFFTLSFGLATGVQFLLARFAPAAAVRIVAASAPDLIEPNPKFSPDRVVELQLSGLADADAATGIQQCFAFASPSNKQATGPLARFAAMVQQAPYNVLLHCQLVLIGKPIIVDNEATVMVTVLDKHDEIRVFEFYLSKQQDKPVENCWMTDGVYPLQQLPRDEAPETPTVWHAREVRGVDGRV
jgi:hypothetical protein